MKKNRMMRLASVLLVLCLLTTSVISGTFAKYTSEATVTDTARVAKWEFIVGGENVATETVVIDLFTTVNGSGVNGDEATNDLDVKDGVDETIIAPGTKGSFEITLENKSEVDATYAVDFTVTNANNIPIKFSVDGGTPGTLEDIIATELEMDDSKTIKVDWEWVYENGTGDTLVTNDKADTDLGKVGTAVITVEAKITATQVD